MSAFASWPYAFVPRTSLLSFTVGKSGLGLLHDSVITLVIITASLTAISSAGSSNSALSPKKHLAYFALAG